MVDAADHEKLDAAKSELLSLVEKPQLAGIPVSETPLCDSYTFKTYTWRPLLVKDAMNLYKNFYLAYYI